MNPTASAILVAAGSGVRFGSAGKVFSQLAGRPMACWSLDALSDAANVEEIILVAADHTQDAALALLRSGNWPKLRSVIPGGKRRQDSVWLGFEATSPGTPFVAIHDAARPLVAARDIDRCIDQASATGASILGAPIADTLKRANADGSIGATISRDLVWAAQTPQVFERSLFASAFERCRSEDWTVTDDASMVERSGAVVTIVQTSVENFKITTAEDASLAEKVLESRQGQTPFQIRTGLGYDVHRFAPGRPLLLGGIEIPSDLGLDGHSDADVLLHAITDALLGSAGFGDIGQHFPPTDEQWRNASSAVFLRHANDMLSERRGRVINVDATVVAEAPRIMPYAAAIRASIASILGIGVPDVNVKATTNEGMGFIGREEGMAALAVVTTLVPAL